MAQASQPTFINLPPPGSNPETPSEMPGTPTSTTTSLSALSTTAIKDGHRGHFPAGNPDQGHQHNPSTTSLEAERADRISRLAGLERVSTLRAPPQTPGSAGSAAGGGGGVGGGGGGGASSLSPQTTPTSTGFPTNYQSQQHPLTPAYFDSNGQPVAITKMSTVGTASATESHVGEGDAEADDGRTTAGERDEDMLSTGTNYREAGSVASTGAYADAMDEDMDGGTPSVGAYEDRMSDDGSASLVGFGEGAGSTVSGPIYHRRPMPGAAAAAGPGPAHAQQVFGQERTISGLSDMRRDRDTPMGGGGGETPVSASAIQERRDARMTDGVAAEPAPPVHPGEQDAFVDTTFRGPVPAGHPQHQPPQHQSREAAENIVQQLDHGETSVGPSALGSPGRGGQPLGQFYFEGEKRGE